MTVFLTAKIVKNDEYKCKTDKSLFFKFFLFFGEINLIFAL